MNIPFSKKCLRKIHDCGMLFLRKAPDLKHGKDLILITDFAVVRDDVISYSFSVFRNMNLLDLAREA